MVYVGLDVHVRNSYFHVIDEEGQLLRRGRRSNTLFDLGSFLGPFEQQPIKLSLENTCNSRAVHRVLGRYAQESGARMELNVLNSRKLRVIAESVTKCDRLDAAVLAELTRADLKLPTVYLPDDQEFALREHLRARWNLVRLRTFLKNAVHGVLHRRGILRPKSGHLFSGPGRAFLEKTELDDAGRILIERYLRLYEQLDSHLSESTAEVMELARQPRWAKPCALLRTIPGVGWITAMTLLAELGDVKRFHSRAAVANYAGLVPIVRSSNERDYRGPISKRGSTHLRRVLVEAAWIACRKVPRYAAMFDRITAARNNKTAVVAVARKMLEDAWTMLIRDEAFRFSPSVTG